MTSPGMTPGSPRFDDEITKEWTPPAFLERREQCEWRRICVSKNENCRYEDCFHEDGSFKEEPSHHIQDVSWTFYLLCGIIVVAGCVAIYFSGVTQ